MTDTPSAATRRRFTRRRWAGRLVAWRAWLVLALATVLVGTGVWVVGWSGVLAVDGVRVDGTDRALTPERVRQVARVPVGTPLARVDLARIESRVESLAAVRDADVSREWPDTVLVRVTEREAVALVEIGGTVRGMDAEGVAFRRYQGEPPALPRVETDASVSLEALREAASVVTAMPRGLSEQVESVSVETVDAITLRLRDGRSVRWGSAEGSDTKAEVLATLMDRDALSYDVSVVPATACVEPSCATSR